ncbi:MAG: DUF488 family protein [Eubacteriales bacterium]|nr:DUF488 family protein [Clostridiales bacterium]MDY5836477.1 DUF488 family protein [Eubacteriales bacterium]
MYKLKIKRVYQAPDPEDGKRILVDRLWPRGVRKADAELDFWWKDAAPSPDLRKWFGHQPERFVEFSEKYQDELDRSPMATVYKEKTQEMLEKEPVTFLYAARDPVVNHAAVLKQWMEKN